MGLAFHFQFQVVDIRLQPINLHVDIFLVWAAPFNYFLGILFLNLNLFFLAFTLVDEAPTLNNEALELLLVALEGFMLDLKG